MTRLIFSILLLLLSLPILFRAPHVWLWLVSVIVTGYSYVFFLACAVILFFAFRASAYRWPSVIFSLAAAIIFTIPIIVAIAKAKQLSKDLLAAFPVKSEVEGVPFSFIKLFSFGKKGRQQTINYKQLDSTSLALDFYSANQTGIRPLVIMIHGGAWMRGSKDDLAGMNDQLANEGYHVAAINYPLAPVSRFPAPIDDVYDAVQFLKKGSSQLRIDTSNIFLLGRSAGGQIALVAAYTNLKHDIKGVIGYYPPADMVWGGQTTVSKWIIDTDLVYDSYFGGQYKEIPEVFKAASARDQVTDEAVPTLLVHGNNDPMVSPEHCRRLQQTLNEHHIPNYYIQIPFATHGFDFNVNGPSGQLAGYAVRHFLKSLTEK